MKLIQSHRKQIGGCLSRGWGRERREGEIVNHQETSEGDAHCLEGGDDFMGASVCPNFSKLLTLNRCSLLYDNYTSTEVLEKNPRSEV